MLKKTTKTDSAPISLVYFYDSLIAGFVDSSIQYFDQDLNPIFILNPNCSSIVSLFLYESVLFVGSAVNRQIKFLT
jgi:hypothetical protein